MELSFYERIGQENIKQLIAYFYDEVRDNAILRPMYPGDMEAAERRLSMFMIQYLGGPATYSERRGHPRLRMRHMSFPIDERARDEWLGCMRKALDKVKMDEESRNFLWSYFSQTADFLRNR
jgi:hemoglobin